jgi:hypothetical protein
VRVRLGSGGSRCIVDVSCRARFTRRPSSATSVIDAEGLRRLGRSSDTPMVRWDWSVRRWAVKVVRAHVKKCYATGVAARVEARDASDDA